MKKIVIISLLLIGVNASYAASSLQDERIVIVKNYLSALEHKNTSEMVALFTPEGSVISTSKGKIDAKAFFSGFLPELSSSKVKIDHIYLATNDRNHLSAKFHFDYTLKNGESGGGNYMDDFTFQNNNKKLVAVHMFENLK